MTKFTFVVFLLGAIINGSSCMKMKDGTYNMGVLRNETNVEAQSGQSKKAEGYFYATVKDDKMTITKDDPKQAESNANMSLADLEANLDNAEHETYVLVKAKLSVVNRNYGNGDNDSITFNVVPELPMTSGNNIQGGATVGGNSQISCQDLQLADNTFKIGYVKHEVAGQTDKVVDGVTIKFEKNADKFRDFFFGTFSNDNKVEIKVDPEVTKAVNTRAQEEATKIGKTAKTFSAKTTLENLIEKVEGNDTVYVLLKVKLTKVPGQSVAEEGHGAQVDFQFEVKT